MTESTTNTAEVEEKSVPPVKRKSMKAAKRLDLIFITAMLVIPCVHWLVFWLGVNFNSLLMAFQHPATDKLSLINMRSVFAELSSGSSNLTIAIKNTLMYFTKDFCMLVFQLLIAYFFYKKIWGKRAFQVIFYLPSIISAVAMVAVFSNVIAPSGPLGIIIQKVGQKFDPEFLVPEFLARSDTASYTIMMYTIWLGWGGNMLLLGGALARIPLEIVESAKLDGIGTVKEITHIILPLIWPTVSTILILMMTGLFTADGPILLFTEGAYSTQTIGYWIFDLVYNAGRLAYNKVAAAGMVFTAIGVPIILGFRWLIEKVPTVEY